ncbi:MAG: hypothetical protein V4850_24505, partial [Myxococcota bacterium]
MSHDGPAVRLLAAVLDAAPPDRVYGDSVRAAPRGAASPEQILAWAAELDAAPAHRSVALGARMALSLYDAHQEWATVTDLEDDHGHDAAVRLVAFAQVVAGAYGGSPSERAVALFCSPAGRALAIWFAAVELALAFLPVDDPLGERVATELFERWSSELPDLAPDVAAVLHELLPSLDGGATACAAGASWVADAVRAALPDLSDRSRDTLAAEPMAVPVYQVLVARLLGEMGVEGEAAGVVGIVDGGAGRAEREAEEKAAAERAEWEAAERAAAEERAAAAERAAAERAAVEQAEREAAEWAAAERAAVEQAAVERAVAEQAEREAAERAAAERAAAEQAEREAAEQAAAEQAAAEQAAAEQAAAEQAAAEQAAAEQAAA